MATFKAASQRRRNAWILGVGLSAGVIGCPAASPDGAAPADVVSPTDSAFDVTGQDDTAGSDVETGDGTTGDGTAGDGTEGDATEDGSSAVDTAAADATITPVSPGESIVVYVASEGAGRIAVRLTLPKSPRFSDGVPIVFEIPTFFTPDVEGFFESIEAWRAGFVHVSALLPGRKDTALGVHSDGEDDYGGQVGTKALADVVRYLSGAVADADGVPLTARLPWPALQTQLGLYAFSHPGIGAVNVLALHKADAASVAWLVGRENPTSDTLSAMEVGHFDDANKPVPNPLYTYAGSYDGAELAVDYSSVRWSGTSPYFDLDGSGAQSAGDHALGDKVPQMYGRLVYSTRLTNALRDYGGLTDATWPTTLTPPDTATELWSFRQSITRYPALAGSGLHVMLVYCRRDHVQILADKPHLHQAWDGFRSAGIWTRLNPDRSYVETLAGPAPSGAQAIPDTDANAAPPDWAKAVELGYPDAAGMGEFVPLAAVSEMADRAHDSDWSANLAAPLVDYAADLGAGEPDTQPLGPDGLVRIPSATAGTTGLVVRVSLPKTPRYADGAPVAVIVAGGWDATTIVDPPLALTDYGFIVLELNLPGGGTGDALSGGTYDTRGPNCWGAVQDVLRFAAGSIKTSSGLSLASVASPIVPMAGNIGLVGLSNGGNGAILAAGAGPSAPPKLAWIVNWESPVGDGPPVSDHGYKASTGTPSPKVNPAYNPDTGVWTWTKLRWDGAFVIESPSGADSVQGAFYIDANGDGVLTPAAAPGSDYVFRPLAHDGKQYWSAQVTQNAASSGVFPTGTVGVATAAEGAAFWKQRNGADWMGAVIARFPDLLFLVIASKQDHVQSAPDYPHVLLQYEAFRAGGARFARLNPDAAYVVAAGAPSVAGLMDNPAGTPFDHMTIRAAVEPESVPQAFTTIGAALELADRTHADDVTPQLDAVLDVAP